MNTFCCLFFCSFKNEYFLLFIVNWTLFVVHIVEGLIWVDVRSWYWAWKWWRGDRESQRPSRQNDNSSSNKTINQTRINLKRRKRKKRKLFFLIYDRFSIDELLIVHFETRTEWRALLSLTSLFLLWHLINQWAYINSKIKDDFVALISN